MATAHQVALVAQLQARYAGESSSAAQKDGEIALLKQQLAEAQAEVASTNAHARKLADEKMSLLVELSKERAEFEKYKTSCLWVLKYLEQGKSRLIANLDEFRQFVKSAPMRGKMLRF